MSAYPYYDLPTGWEGDVLRGIQAPITAGNVQLLDVWTALERGLGSSSYAGYNPFNTTQTEPGSTTYNSVGVQNFKDWASGLQASVATLENGFYPNILRQIRAGTIQANSTFANPELLTWSGNSYSSLNLAAYPSAVPSTRFTTGGSTNGGTYIPGTNPSTPGIGGIQQWINDQINKLDTGSGNIPGTNIPANVPYTAVPGVAGVESAISQAGGIGAGLETVFGWLGNQLFRWVILIILGLAMLVVLDQLLAQGGGVQQVRKAFR